MSATPYGLPQAPCSADLGNLQGRRFDVVVVGAGVAGAMVSRELARTGLTVLVVDKARFPRWKVCGGCLNRRALGALEAAGLSSLLEAIGAQTLRRLHVAAGGVGAEVPLPDHRSVSRYALDAALVGAACAAGITFVEGAKATLRGTEEEQRTVRLQQAERSAEVTARVVVAADGLGGRLLRGTEPFESDQAANSRIGAGAMFPQSPPQFEPGTIYMACGGGGYVGVVRVEDDRLDVAAALDAPFVKTAGSLPAAVGAILREAGLPALEDDPRVEWRGTPALTRTASKLWAHRVFVLGDAAGYVEPFTGEGMAWALSSGRLAAPLIAQSVAAYSPDLGRAWEREYHTVVRRRQFVCRYVAQALRSPVAVAAAVRVLSAFPAVARPVVSYMNEGAA